MIDQTPDPWTLMVQKWRGDAGVLRAAANPLSASDMEAAKMEEGAATLLYCAEQVDRALAAERAQTARVEELNRNALHAQRERAIAAEHGLAQRDETIRRLQDAFARCQEVQQATAETWRIEHDQMAEQIRLLRGAMAADDERLRRAAEQAGILYVSCDTAEALAEQITRLSAQVAELEAERAAEREAELADPVAQRADRYAAEASDLTLRLIAAEAERDAAQQREVEANNYFRMSQSNYDEAMRQLRAAQQQIATLTQERDKAQQLNAAAYIRARRQVNVCEPNMDQYAGAMAVIRAAFPNGHIDFSDWVHIGLVEQPSDLLQAVKRRAEAAEARCATLTAALEQLRDCDWTIGRGDRMDPVRDIARNALSGVPTP